MITAVETWVRNRENPVSEAVYRVAKSIRTIDIPASSLFGVLYTAHTCIAGSLSWFTRTFYWTPLFRSRLRGSHKNLHLAGSGIPLITGPVQVAVGDRCRLSTAITISGRPSSTPHPYLHIGNNVGIGWQTTIAVGTRIVLKDNVRIAGRAFLAGYPGHPVDPVARAAGQPDLDQQARPIVLHEDVWLGTGCIVNGGVEIGAGTIVAAGSVVTKSLPPGVLAAGSPARIVKKLEI